jgi:hypothetical protein
MDPIEALEDAQTLAQAIVNTIPEPLLVLDERFRVPTASRSLYETFKGRCRPRARLSFERVRRRKRVFATWPPRKHLSEICFSLFFRYDGEHL